MVKRDKFGRYWRESGVEGVTGRGRGRRRGREGLQGKGTGREGHGEKGVRRWLMLLARNNSGVDFVYRSDRAHFLQPRVVVTFAKLSLCIWHKEYEKGLSLKPALQKVLNLMLMCGTGL